MDPRFTLKGDADALKKTKQNKKYCYSEGHSGSGGVFTACDQFGHSLGLD